jgi:phage FluMu gp28-like protein
MPKFTLFFLDMSIYKIQFKFKSNGASIPFLIILVYQLAQAALQLTGTGVGIANQASERYG